MNLRSSPVSVPFLAFALFVALCTLFGGSSRSDVVYLLILRPFTIILLAVFLVFATREALRELKLPLLLLLAFALTMIVQLDLFGTSWGDPTGLAPPELVARRLSISPDRTWNSLIALLIPLTALIGFAALGHRRGWVTATLLIMISASAVFGVFNIASGEQGSVSLYEQFNRGTPNGFLANRNHQAALLATGLPLLRVWSLGGGGDRRSILFREGIALALALPLALLIFLSGSRSGLLLLGVSIVGSVAIQPQGILSGVSRRGRLLFAGGGAFAAAAITLVAILLGGAHSLDRLIRGVEDGGESRLTNLPAMLGLIRDALPFGTGFGTFDPAFRMVETDAMLGPAYFNNAHSDLIELAITGGIPALIVLVAFLCWWLWRSVVVFRAGGRRTDVYFARAGSVGILVLLLASLTDYPLRTPLLAMVFALFCASISAASQRLGRVARIGGGV